MSIDFQFLIIILIVRPTLKSSKIRLGWLLRVFADEPFIRILCTDRTELELCN